VRATGGKCRHCWTRIRQGEPALRAGVRYRPRPGADEAVHEPDCARGWSVSASAVREVHSVLSSAFKQAVVWGWTAHNPAKLATPPAAGTPLAPDAYLFSRSADGRSAISPDGISHRFQELAADLGVRARLHDLRHFMVTQLVAGGVDWRTVSGRAGHADGHMTLATYAHFQAAQDRQAAKLMEALLGVPKAGAGG
jgi:integrase